MTEEKIQPTIFRGLSDTWEGDLLQDKLPMSGLPCPSTIL